MSNQLILSDPTPAGAPRLATHCFRRFVSCGDEAEFVPTLRLYLAGCNFRCRFCNVAPECFIPDQGERVDAEQLARECVDALDAGVKTITILGGEPTVHTDTILRIADAALDMGCQGPLPIVLNTNGSFPPETIEKLAHVVQTWVVDFKFGNDDCARRLARVRGYLAKVTPNLVALQALGRLHVRHLLMPGHVDCCFVPAARWLNDRLPGSRLALMTGYVPGWKAVGDPLLGRLLSREEIRQAVDFLDTTNLNWSAPDDVTARH